MENMTAKISAFVRAYHMNNSNIKIYNDRYATKILYDEEYKEIYKNLKEGIKFFNPNYNGNNPVGYIVNNYIGPTVIFRSAFNYKYLMNEIKLGLKQYVLLGSGYDTSGYLVNNLVKVFELDKESVIEDKIKRINNLKIDNNNICYVGVDFNEGFINQLLNNKFDKNLKTMVSILGVSYYLNENVFFNMLKSIGDILSVGSIILFDYPSEYNDSDKNRVLANGAKEEMKSVIKYLDIVEFCDKNNFYIVENVDYKDMETDYFYDYNTINPDNLLKVVKDVNCCVLVKK